jgi:hypothetical protein
MIKLTVNRIERVWQVATPSILLTAIALGASAEEAGDDVRLKIFGLDPARASYAWSRVRNERQAATLLDYCATWVALQGPFNCYCGKKLRLIPGRILEASGIGYLHSQLKCSRCRRLNIATIGDCASFDQGLDMELRDTLAMLDYQSIVRHSPSRPTHRVRSGFYTRPARRTEKPARTR